MVLVQSNQKELEALEKFRPRVKDILDEPEDYFLLRWLRARNLDIGKAEEMLRNYVTWRKENEDLRNLPSWKPRKSVLENIHFKFTGFDFEGRPVLWLGIGKWNVRQLITDGYKPDCIRYQYKILEEIVASLEKQRTIHGVNQFVIIADSEGMTFWKLAHYETIELILRFFREFESYYPELLHSCYIVNNPMVFSYIFNLVKPLLSTHTLSKVQMFDSNANKWKNILRKAIPSESLPFEYGGTGSPVNQQIGP